MKTKSTDKIGGDALNAYTLAKHPQWKVFLDLFVLFIALCDSIVLSTDRTYIKE